jgi:hypothetical protein
MKVFLSLASGIMLFSVLSFQANAKGHGHGHGHEKGHGYSKHYYKKQKHYCNAHCHHVYREKVVIVQPQPVRPSVTISLPL